ncbi:REP-associated tyrosine transposase [Arenimonas metalli]|nr:transposase [Arenimonas metalli]
MPPLTHRHRQSDLRNGRRTEPGRAYFLTTVTHTRLALFSDWEPARHMSRYLADPGAWPGAELLCWVLMPDHWHGLLIIDGTRTLASIMKVAKGGSARSFNQAMGRTGSVWATAFHDHAVRREEDLREVARYIIRNPIRAGLVKSCGDYPFWDAAWLNPWPDIL